MQNMMTSVYMNTAAYAQDTCAASSCAAMNFIILVLDAGLLLASIIILLALLVLVLVQHTYQRTTFPPLRPALPA